jgi:hypothetical protein
VNTGAAGFGTEEGLLYCPGTNSTAFALKWVLDGVGVVSLSDTIASFASLISTDMA